MSFSTCRLWESGKVVHHEALRRVATVVVAAGVVLVSSVLVLGDVVATHDSVVMLNSPGVRKLARDETLRFQCLEAALRAQVPAGSLVFDDGGDSLDYQRIAEQLTPGYRFTATPVVGAYRVSFRQPGSCLGRRVEVRRVTAP